LVDIIIIASLCNRTQVYQISASTNQEIIFGEFLYSIFMVLQDILLQAIGVEFFKFDYGYM
jgi:hypothetical protein